MPTIILSTINHILKMKHINITLFGQVQGVFFRVGIKELADKLGVKGFIKNLEDGSLYIEAEGNEESLDQFVFWCKKGPKRAKVDNYEIKDGEFEDFESFEIN